MKVKSESEVAQSCLTLSDPMDCSLPGSSVHGIFQARVLEWGAIVFSHVLYSWSLLVIHFKYMLVTFEFYKLVTAFQTTDVKSQCIAKDPNAGKD